MRDRSDVARRHLGVAAALAVVAALASGCASSGAFAEPIPPTPAGRMSLFLNASSEYDDMLNGARGVQRTWLAEHVKRARVYTTFFDDKTAWYPNAYVYVDAFAVYDTRHPDVKNNVQYGIDQDWVLRSAPSARAPKAYINYLCDHPYDPDDTGPREPIRICAQYAADVTNPAWRRWTIDEIRKIFARTPAYRGVFFDDVNWSSGDVENPLVPASDGTGKYLQTTYHRTPNGWTVLTLPEWQGGMRTFLQELRAALDEISGSGPQLGIIPNSPHATAYPGQADNPDIVLGHRVSEAIEMERGFNDNFVAGMSQWGLTRAMRWVDALHDQGRGVVEDVIHDWVDPAQNWDYEGGLVESRDFALAMYFLMNEGRDSVGFPSSTVEAGYWPGWDTDLGQAKGPRYEWEPQPGSGKFLLRRDFTNGFVLVNPPERNVDWATATSTSPIAGSDAVTVDFEQPYRTAGGETVTSTTLTSRRGAVFVGSPSVPAGTMVNHASGPGVLADGSDNQHVWERPYMVNDMAPGLAQQGGTRWKAPSNEAGNFVSLDFGQPRLLTSVRVRWESAATYQVQTSADGVTWSTLARETVLGPGARVSTFRPQGVRHLRVVITAADPDPAQLQQINEIEALGPAHPDEVADRVQLTTSRVAP